MKSFSFNTISTDYAAKVLRVLNENIGYVIWANGAQFREAYNRIFMAAMRSENRKYSDLTPYIKKLARTVMKTRVKEKPYALYDENGEIAYAFQGLIVNPETDIQENNIPRLLNRFRELYLMYPEDFGVLKEMLPSTEATEVKTKIKNNPLRDSIYALMAEYDARQVFKALIAFFKELDNQTVPVKTAESTKIYSLKPANVANLKYLSDKKWVQDKYGNTYGINPSTLTMDYNVELGKFRLAVPTSCNIWKMDCSEYYEDIENKIYAEQGVNNDYITWCGDKYRLTTPAGTRYLGIDRNKFMDIVRQELILSVLAAQLGTVVAVSPDNIYLRITKASATSFMRLRTISGKTFTFPLSVQPVTPAKIKV